MKQISKILIPTDFSPSAWEAVQYGLSLARSEGLNITLLHVFPSAAQGKNGFEPGEKEEYQSFLDQMQSLCDRLKPRHPGIDFHCELLRGSVNQELADFLAKNHYDLIIMGVNSSVNHNSMGKHTAAMLRFSNIPVLIVPNVKEASPQPSPETKH